ncbi:glyoxalase/bleomycin resistance/dioxygenase family protein [Neobacillus notoginsengisoli]|uniref:Glyoxalase/bleomycin resistance/dioxygenase family protein n=1 Tax=Neobacillus notoginsengisoli TaxID=1578198 RepID=A0A417Z020_9BACI|nr:VOC family protein [Neobacillus notoginsengisoli]RHW43425.1 glyoxalase/bleomycin resistance/dioxygenase family protein [Neobacillus notoginsengisoli]
MYLSAFPALYTSDINRSLTFYKDLLEFEETFRFPVKGEPEHVELRLGDSMIALTTYDAAKEGSVSAPTPGHPFELSIWAENAVQAINRLREAEVTVVLEPRVHKARLTRAYVSDPDGNWIAIVSHNE